MYTCRASAQHNNMHDAHRVSMHACDHSRTSPPPLHIRLLIRREHRRRPGSGYVVLKHNYWTRSNSSSSTSSPAGGDRATPGAPAAARAVGASSHHRGARGRGVLPGEPLHDVLEVGLVRAHLPRDDVLHLHLLLLLLLVLRRRRPPPARPGGLRRRAPRSAAASRLALHAIPIACTASLSPALQWWIPENALFIYTAGWSWFDRHWPACSRYFGSERERPSREGMGKVAACDGRSNRRIAVEWEWRRERNSSVGKGIVVA